MHKCGPLLCRAQGNCPYCYVRNRTKLGLKRATTFSFHSPTFELPKIDKRYGINPTNRFGPGSPSPVATCHTKRVAIDSTIGYSCTLPFPPSFSSPKSRFSFISDSPPSHKNYPSLSFPLSEDIAEKNQWRKQPLLSASPPSLPRFPFRRNSFHLRRPLLSPADSLPHSSVADRDPENLP